MQVVTAEGIDRALAMPSLIAALDRAFRGGITAPPRHHHEVPRPDGNATLLLMPAWSAGEVGDFLGVKTVSVFPGNRSRGLPSVQGAYLLMDGATGVSLATMDGARLTLWRTAATSALAARHLARPDATRMLMVGAGALAPFLIRAHAAVRPLTRIAVWNRNPAGAAALAGQLAREGLPAVVAEGDLAREVAASDLVSCATLSETPIVRGEWLASGSHLDLVGAFTLGMREADDAALARASVYVDTEACATEGGDVAVAIRAGTFARGAICGDLANLVSGRVAGRTSPDEITLFKSIGASLEDLAAAIEVWRNLASA